MNTQLKVVKANKSTDNLLILSNKNNLNWSKEYLSDTEHTFLEQAVAKNISYIVFPQAERIVVVQFIKTNTSASIQKEDMRLAGSELLSSIEHYKIESLTLLDLATPSVALEFVEGMVLGNYQFLKYFTHKKDKTRYLKTICIHQSVASEEAIRYLRSVLEATCLARDLVNEPPSYLTAAQMSKDIEKVGKNAGFSVTVFDEKKIKKLKMGGLLAVNSGSFTPPRFNILEWKSPNAKNSRPIILVGKGVVYDTGGLSLKPTANSMDRMKADMGGAATVVGVLAAAAQAALPLHIIGLIPSTDNRPGNNAYAPGDVITMYDGSTVEVLNTDAEGRMILADALHYAKQYDPELVMDFATLTGAAVRAVGHDALCFMGNADAAVKQQLLQSGHDVYERLVEFPLWREYGDQMKSNIADIKNLGGPTAGMITAGKFLEHFTDYPWVHFDLSGAYLTKASGYRPKEGTGVGVRLIFDFLKKYYL